MNVSGGVWNIACDGNGGLLNIASGNPANGDTAGSGSLAITGGLVHAFGGITIGDVYSQGGSAGLLSVQGGTLNMASNGAAGGAGRRWAA